MHGVVQIFVWYALQYEIYENFHHTKITRYTIYVSYRGMQSVVADYSSEAMRKILNPLLYLVSLGTFAGLVYLNFADIGICAAVKLIWSK